MQCVYYVFLFLFIRLQLTKRDVFQMPSHIAHKLFSPQMIWRANFSWTMPVLIQNAMNRSKASLLLFLGHPVSFLLRAMWRTFSNASWYLELLHPFKCTVYAPRSLKERAGCSINSFFVGEKGRREERCERKRRHKEERKGDGKGGERVDS